MNYIQKKWIRMITEQKGVGTLEFLMILAVLVSIAVVFRQWLFTWIGDVLSGISPISSAPVSGLPTPSIPLPSTSALH